MIERRSLQANAEAGKIRVTIPFNSWSEDLGGFRERIVPGAFKRSLSGNDEILALWSHDTSKPLAKRSAGTLVLSADDRELTAKITPDATTWAADAQHSIESGTTRGSSFAFQTVEDLWYRKNGQWHRDLVDAKLIEVSPVVAPAYPASTATAE